MLVRLAIRF